MRGFELIVHELEDLRREVRMTFVGSTWDLARSVLREHRETIAVSRVQLACISSQRARLVAPDGRSAVNAANYRQAKNVGREEPRMTVLGRTLRRRRPGLPSEAVRLLEQLP